MYLWTAFTIGLFGSLHCAGMCGPIAMAISGAGRRGIIGNALLYNLGRMVTYSLLGAIIGIVGKGIYFAGLQKYMAIGIGVALLLIAVFSINMESKIVAIPGFNALIFRVKSQLGRLLKGQSRYAAFFIGMTNGLLPCGLVYMAIVGALSTGDWASGAAYMMLFGAGTVPMMLLTGLAGNFASLRARNILRKAYPAFLLLFALLFLFRGFNFHVPGDFFFWEKMGDIPMCH